MDQPKNPLLEPRIRTMRPDELTAPHVRFEKEPLDKRELLKLFRQESAAYFVGTLEPGFHRFGFSKGQFSLIDLIREITGQTGPVDFLLSTWTVAHADLGELQQLCNPERLRTVRMLIDFSFQRRQPALIAHLRKTFGNQSIVITRNHAKFMLFGNSQWKIVCRTSMNLNFNPRLEDVEIKDDPPLYAFLEEIAKDIFGAYAARKQAEQTTAQLAADFNTLLR